MQLGNAVESGEIRHSHPAIELRFHVIVKNDDAFVVAQILESLQLGSFEIGGVRC